MTELTDFFDTSDVSDAAIEWAVRETNGSDSARTVREASRHINYALARSRIIAARLIQQHRPELLVDPAGAAVEKFMQEANFCSHHARDCAKRLYQMGLEAGKAS